MTFKSKRTIVSMMAGVILAVAYIMYALGTKAPSLSDISAWAVAMLVFIGIAIVASIVIQILFHILYSIGIAVKERDLDDKEVERIIESETVEDEDDKTISLKTSRAGYFCTGIGFIIALVWLAFMGTSMVVAFHILLGAIFIGSFIEGIMSVRYYERGI